MTDRRKRKSNPNSFCCVCGKYTLPAHRRNIAYKMKIAYNCYFGYKVGEQNKKWAPHICCNSCNTQLLRRAAGKQKKMLFAVQMIWREPTDHVTDCYFCLTNVKGFSKNKSKIVYPSCQSALKPVPHGTDIPIPKAPSSKIFERPESSSEPDSSSEATSSDFKVVAASSNIPVFINQSMLNNLARDLALPKCKAEILG